MDPNVDRPVKELKGFKRISLLPGESKTVIIPVNLQVLAFWNNDEHQWKIHPGKYLIEIGNSSQNFVQKAVIAFP